MKVHKLNKSDNFSSALAMIQPYDT